MTLNEQLATCVKNFWRNVNEADGDGAGYWLERFSDFMDLAEAGGMRLDGVPLPTLDPLKNLYESPETAKIVASWPATCINWGKHNGFTNKRDSDLPPKDGPRGRTILVNETIARMGRFR